MINVAVLHPIDPAGHVPSGIDSFVRGILKFAPADIQYTLFGSTSDVAARPPGRRAVLRLGEREIAYWPLVSMDPNAQRGLVPLSLRYMAALAKARSAGLLDGFQIFDFQRIEPVFVLGSDRRPKNVILHQDMSVIRDKNSDILWRYAPSVYESVERRAFARLDHIFAVRQSAVQRYRAMYPQWSERFSFIPTWVDSSVFTPDANEESRSRSRTELRDRLQIASDARVLAFVGRLDQQKDPLLLLSALKICVVANPGVHLMIIGDGVLRTKVEAVAQSPELAGHVHFVGVQSPQNIAGLLRGSDLYVLSSAYEGMPIALLEALATGLPAVTTDVGEVRMVVNPGVNGQISSDRSDAAFARAIQDSLAAAESLRGKPCLDAVKPFMPEIVLDLIYRNHRRQAA